MNKKIKLKRLMIGVMSAITVVSLASCKDTSTNTIDTSSIYAQTTVNGKTYTVTNGELWNELKWNSTDFISKKINDVILDDCIKEVESAISVLDGKTTELSNEKLKRYLDYLEQSAFVSIFETSSYENFLELYPTTVNKSIASYIDTAYLEEGKVLNADDFTQQSITDNAKTLFTGTSIETTYYLYPFYDGFIDTCAQKILAYYYQEDYINDYNDEKDDEEDYYYTDSDIIQYYKENYQYAEDRQAIIISFTNSEEIDSTLKAFGVKVYNDAFYFIPQGKKTNTEYSTYYDDFDVSKAANSENCFNMMSIGGESLIFEFYLAMYNYIYIYKDALPTVDNVRSDYTTNKREITESILVRYINAETNVDAKDIIQSWDSDMVDLITYSQESLDEISSDFKLYVNKTLRVDADYADGESRFSTSGKSYNSNYYMVYKISENELRDEYVLLENEDDTEISDEYEDYKNNLIEEMIWSDLTDSFISDILSDKIEDVTVYIYDDYVEIAYSQANSTYSKTYKNAPSSDTLFTIKYDGKKYNYTIDECFEQLLLEDGVTTTIDILSKKVIKDTDEYEKTKENRKDYETTIELLLAYFANDQLSSYSSSLGKYNFLMLYFHTSEIDEIIDDYYRVNEASNKILTDFGTNDKFYDMVLNYATIAYNKSYTLSASGLLVYVDMDEDGSPDENFDWSTVVATSTEGKTYADMAVELISYMVSRMQNSTDDQLTLLTEMVDEYTASQRFTNGIDVYDPDNNLGLDDYDPTEPESIWAEYKRAGILVKINEYTDISNTTTVSNADDGIRTEIKDRLKDLYSSIQYNGIFPSEYVDSEDYVGENATGWKTDLGYSMLVISSATAKSSAKFENKDDINGLFKNISVMYDDANIIISDIYNTEDIATLNQIKLYIFDYLNNEGSTMLPESVSTFFTDYVEPIYSKYTDSSTQRELVYIKLLNSRITFTDDANNTRLDKIIEINHRISDDYLDNNDDGYVFTDWWETIVTLKD